MPAFLRARLIRCAISRAFSGSEIDTRARSFPLLAPSVAPIGLPGCWTTSICYAILAQDDFQFKYASAYEVPTEGTQLMATEATVLVASVEKKSGEKNGKPWTRYALK